MQTLALDTFDIPLLGRIHQITVPTPFAVGPVHTYLLAGESLALIDTGPMTAEALTGLRAGLAELGYALSDLEQILISHAHADHYGLMAPLVEASGSQVWAHVHAQPILENWTDYRMGRRAFWEELLRGADVPPAEARRSVALYDSYRRFQTHGPLNRLLEDGSQVEMGGATWQVLHCPGHAGSLVCFYQPESRLLIGSDHLLSHISSNAIVEPPLPWQAERRKPLVEYWQSLCRVHDLEVALTLPGHGDTIINHRDLIGHRFRFYERRLGRLRAELHEGPRTAWQLARSLFRALDDADTFLAVSEVVGHLDVLEERGEVMRSEDAGVWTYQLVEMQNAGGEWANERIAEVGNQQSEV